MNLAKIKSADFIAGYVYKSVEYNCATNTKAFKDIPEEGYKNDIAIPKVWIGGDYKELIDSTDFQVKMESILNEIREVFDTTFNSNAKHMKLILAWGQANSPGHVVVQYCLIKDEPKKMTVAEIEEQLGYRIEIVREAQ